MASTGEVFHASAPHYRAAAELLWDRLGEEYVRWLAPSDGERVLDACCGAGSSAIPAAHAVGPQGRVDAVDLASGLVELARDRAAEQGLAFARFHVGDVDTWSPSQPYDLVQCGYGVFFFPDMNRSARRLADLLRPGGRFSATVWAKGALERFGGLLHAIVTDGRPSTTGQEPLARRAAARINDAEKLAAWASELGLREVAVHRFAVEVDLTADDAWGFVLGSGFRAMLDDLTKDAVERVRDRFRAAVENEGPDVLDTTSLAVVGHT
ncbi:class I SAM-dependent methyltransferase [Actinomadura geliboluensis]|uniref:Methyltransferase domain-containing protein n=1 Tax=Actinomadura geliboluensis TaxID=882440 RepID=A0A5S4H5P4_9ACTN|nr:class I SAM-dependent methyltransferase [Actinomadura geliboluensis]TMR40545.1 methyltransferase domain-containing protein [Actinomadura geliboluensis]